MTIATIVRRGATLGLGLILVMAWCSTGLAYDRWSIDDDATNCGACHGDFRSNGYTSPSDGLFWGNLHNIHRQDMVSGDCDTCHAANRFPVLLNSADGGSGLDPISCMGCHGRAEDNTVANPEVATGARSGYGAAMRQHHFRTGITVCGDCHLDADPLNYTAVGENVPPVYYANPGTNHPDIPTDPCNDDGSENFAGATVGIDNDGDLAYDMNDGDCGMTAAPERVPVAALLRNEPNPFNPQTTIHYTVSAPGLVRINVYDTAGRLVRELVDSVHSEAGEFTVDWNGRDTRGVMQASGVYYYRLEGETAETRKMILVK